jgi:hypothetical protein
MKKMVGSCLVSFCLLWSAFAATSYVVDEESDCKKQCPATNPAGCKLDRCYWHDDGSVACVYPHSCNLELD